MDQPGKVASPARGQLNRENEHFPVSVRCMVITYIAKGEDQPGKVANPSCGQLNRENEYFPVSLRA